jgi:hypothetical protein
MRTAIPLFVFVSLLFSIASACARTWTEAGSGIHCPQQES